MKSVSFHIPPFERDFYVSNATELAIVDAISWTAKTGGVDMFLLFPQTSSKCQHFEFLWRAFCDTGIFFILACLFNLKVIHSSLVSLCLWQ